MLLVVGPDEVIYGCKIIYDPSLMKDDDIIIANNEKHAKDLVLSTKHNLNTTEFVSSRLKFVNPEGS